MTTPETLQRGGSAVTVARDIRNLIESREPGYRHEQQLPSTRVLADQYKTSIATVTRAMQQLAEDGMVVNRDRSSRWVYYPDKASRGRGAPVVVVVGGYAGSGKTETGRILARMTGWPMLDKDSCTRPVVEAALMKLGLSPHDRESETYLSIVRPAEYEALRMVTAENVGCGNSVIVTAPHTLELRDPVWCERFASEMDELGATTHAVWVRCDPASMRTYILRRGAARDAHKLANWDSYVAGLDLQYMPAMTPHTIIQNSQSSPDLKLQIENLLDRIGVEVRS